MEATKFNKVLAGATLNMSSVMSHIATKSRDSPSPVKEMLRQKTISAAKASPSKLMQNRVRRMTLDAAKSMMIAKSLEEEQAQVADEFKDVERKRTCRERVCS